MGKKVEVAVARERAQREAAPCHDGKDKDKDKDKEVPEYDPCPRAVYSAPRNGRSQ